VRSPAPLRRPGAIAVGSLAIILLAAGAPAPVAAPVAAADPGSAGSPGLAASVASALGALAPQVERTSHDDALRHALVAYHAYRAARPAAVRKPYLWFIDFGLDNRTPRGWIFDMDRLTVVEGPFHVSHGRGSTPVRDAVPTRFTNIPGSYTSSLGVYLAEETYTFSGRAGGGRYTSVGLRMRGESGPFNSAARRRGIVAHGAPYVTAGGAGRSEGCPAIEQQRARRLLPRIAHGGVVIIYSPNDREWLGRDPWLNGPGAAQALAAATD
jgi:hypothetical protein